MLENIEKVNATEDIFQICTRALVLFEKIYQLIFGIHRTWKDKVCLAKNSRVRTFAC